MLKAIVNDAEIYIFDDSFSALDYKTDKKVRENLRNMNDGATKVIVAQRIGTILDADQIFVIEDGKIVGHLVVSRGGTRIAVSNPDDIVIGPIWIIPSKRNGGNSTRSIR